MVKQFVYYCLAYKASATPQGYSHVLIIAYFFNL